MEIFLFIVLVVLGIKIARIERLNWIAWGVLSLGICAVFWLFVPWRYLRVLLAGAAIVVAFMVRKFIRPGG